MTAVSIGLDSTLTVALNVHREQEFFSLQIHDLDEEEAPLVAHRLLAGLRLAS